MDPVALKTSWARVAANGDAVPSYFYAALFANNPDIRQMFPMSMAAQRDRLVSALGKIVSNVDNLDEAVPFVQGLGRDHRRFEVRSEHYQPVGEALLATLEHFLGAAWTPQLADDWTDAYGLVAQVMTEAAEQSTDPPYWVATVVEHARRGLDTAVVRLRPDEPFHYTPGQSCAVEIADRPKMWRYYSPANAPRRDGTIDLHVKAVAGGHVSTPMVNALAPGDRVRLGAPVGHLLTLDAAGGKDLLLLAGGTGLAPLKALVEQVALDGGRQRVALYAGARTQSDLYDLASLEAMARDWPWLSVVPVVSHDQWYTGERGYVAEVALRHGGWDDRHVYVCGSRDMVRGSRERLLHAGIPASQIHWEDYDNDPYGSVDGVNEMEGLPLR